MTDALSTDAVQQAQRHGAEIVALLQSSAGDEAMLSSYQQRIEQIDRETALADLEAVLGAVAGVVPALAPVLMSIPSADGPLLMLGVVEFEDLARAMPVYKTVKGPSEYWGGGRMVLDRHLGTRGRALVAVLTSAGEMRLVRGEMVCDDRVVHLPTTAPFGTDKDGLKAPQPEFSAESERCGFFLRRIRPRSTGLREHPLPAATYRALAQNLACVLEQALERTREERRAITTQVRAANLPSLSG